MDCATLLGLLLPTDLVHYTPRLRRGLIRRVYSLSLLRP